MLTVKRRKLEYFSHIMYRISQNIDQAMIADEGFGEEEFLGWLTCKNGWEQFLLNCFDAQPIRLAMIIANIHNRIGQ